MAEARIGNNEAPSCHGGLENLDQEHDYWIDEVEGQVPGDLHGTFFRNGPGRQRIGDTKYGHWFDGDGMICAFSIVDGKVHFKNRYVRTPKYVDETASQKIEYRGFGTQRPGGLKANFLRPPANPANTSLIHHGGKLLALNEGGRPWSLDPGTLDTHGEYTYEGSLGPSNVFSAHGKVHQSTGDYINFGAGVSGIGWRGPKACLNIYRVNPAGKMINKAQVPLDTFPFCHDFAMTERYAIFFLSSIVVASIGQVVLGRRTIADQIHFDDQQNMRVLVIDLNTLEVHKQFETAPGAMIHFGNAYDDGDEIVVDGMYASDFEANKTLTDVFNPDGRFGGGSYQRYRLNLHNGAMTAAQVCDTESEFPVFNPAKTGVRNEVTYTACSVYNGANSYFNAFQRITHDGDATVVTLPAGLYGAEPMFAPAKNAAAEDDGYLLNVVYNAFDHRSELHIHRADNVEDQLAVLKLKHHVPHQFHGQFDTEVFMTG